MLQNAYFLAKIGADTAENEQHFAEILPKTTLRVQPGRGMMVADAHREFTKLPSNAEANRGHGVRIRSEVNNFEK